MSLSDKNNLRKLASELWKTASLEEIAENIIPLIKNSTLFINAQNILFYYPFKTEINILPLLESALLENKNCFLPKYINSQIAYSRIHSLDETNLQIGIYKNIESTEKPLFDFEKLDLILVPALAFDKKGYRLGRGKGFYDKLLSKTVQAVFIGLIPSIVLFETLNCLDEWDIPVHYIVSERGFEGKKID